MGPEVRWARSPKRKVWHAFVFFDGYETLASVCTASLKVPATTLPKPITQGVEGICVNCRLGVMGMKKRYRREENASE